MLAGCIGQHPTNRRLDKALIGWQKTLDQCLDHFMVLPLLGALLKGEQRDRRCQIDNASTQSMSRPTALGYWLGMVSRTLAKPIIGRPVVYIPCPKDVFQHLKRHDDTRDARAISALFSQPVFKPQNRRQLILCHRLA